MKTNKSVFDEHLPAQLVEIFTDILNMSLIDFFTACAKKGIDFQIVVSALTLTLYKFAKVSLDSEK